MSNSLRRLAYLLPAALLLCASLSWAETEVRVLPAPDRALVPDVVMDQAGVLHMVYALDETAYYVRSTDNGATFTPPVKVNSEGTVGQKMGERGPKLAVGGDGVIHVVWGDAWYPGVPPSPARYARSLDGGKTFLPRQNLSTMFGNDGLTVAADNAGHVVAFWHTMQPPKPDVPQATWLFMARSNDSGATFAENERVQITGHSGLACSMCMTRARFGPDGRVYLIFRSAEQSVRDFYVLSGSPTENNFTAVRVNEDNWVLPSCPMCGPELTFDPTGRAVSAYMSRHRVYWSLADPHYTSFRLHVATPDNADQEIYPTAVANRQGEVLFLWQVGPMSLNGTAVVKWALYSKEGEFTGRQATVGTSFSGTKATAFVGTDDNFYLVTTAK